MRKFYRITCIIVITAAVAALLCSLAWVGLHNKAQWYDAPTEQSEAIEPETTNKREAPESATVNSAVDKYRAWLEDQGDIHAEEDMADDTAISVCEAFDAGLSYREVADTWQNVGFTMEESVTIVMGAIAYYCPEHNKAVDAYLNGVVADMGESI